MRLSRGLRLPSKLTPAEAAEKLRSAHPSIEIPGGRESLMFKLFMIRPHEVRIVARRTKEVLGQAAGRG